MVQDYNVGGKVRLEDLLNLEEETCNLVLPSTRTSPLQHFAEAYTWTSQKHDIPDSFLIALSRWMEFLALPQNFEYPLKHASR